MTDSSSHASKVRGEVSAAIRESKDVKIKYVMASAEETNRVVEPVHQDETLFWAYCQLRQNWRCFRFDRVQEISPLPGTIPARSIPYDLTLFPWQSSGRSKASSSGARRPARTTSSQYRTSGSGCAVILAAPYIGLGIPPYAGKLQGRRHRRHCNTVP